MEREGGEEAGVGVEFERLGRLCSREGELLLGGGEFEGFDTGVVDGELEREAIGRAGVGLAEVEVNCFRYGIVMPLAFDGGTAGAAEPLIEEPIEGAAGVAFHDAAEIGGGGVGAVEAGVVFLDAGAEGGVTDEGAEHVEGPGALLIDDAVDDGGHGVERIADDGHAG